MSMRDSLVPAVVGGGATAARLLIATLAFTALYAGAEAAHTASGRGSAHTAAGTSAGDTDTAGRTATVHLTSSAARPAPFTAQTRPKPGLVTISAVSAGASEAACRRAYQAQTLITAADGGAVYHWRLQRWSDVSHTWRPYMSASAGFADTTRPARWRPQIVANPGWYRVEIKVQPGGTYRSEGFEVTC